MSSFHRSRLAGLALALGVVAWAAPAGAAPGEQEFRGLLGKLFDLVKTNYLEILETNARLPMSMRDDERAGLEAGLRSKLDFFREKTTSFLRVAPGVEQAHPSLAPLVTSMRAEIDGMGREIGRIESQLTSRRTATRPERLQNDSPGWGNDPPSGWGAAQPIASSPQGSPWDNQEPRPQPYRDYGVPSGPARGWGEAAASPALPSLGSPASGSHWADASGDTAVEASRSPRASEWRQEWTEPTPGKYGRVADPAPRRWSPAAGGINPSFAAPVAVDPLRASSDRREVHRIPVVLDVLGAAGAAVKDHQVDFVLEERGPRQLEAALVDSQGRPGSRAIGVTNEEGRSRVDLSLALANEDVRVERILVPGDKRTLCRLKIQVVPR